MGTAGGAMTTSAALVLVRQARIVRGCGLLLDLGTVERTTGGLEVDCKC